MAAPPYIDIQNLGKKFGDNVILDNVNISFPFNEITGIVGISGCGKTTLLNLLIGFVKPSSGEILFQSRNIFKDMKNVQTIFGFGTQDFSFYEELTVEENLMYFGRLYHLHKGFLQEKIEELLDLVELTYARKTLAGALSSGMGRRLDIACALIHSPKVLILDEPTQDLDVLLRKDLVRTLKRIKTKNNTTIIITSHLLDELDELCDKVAIMSNHSIAEFGSPAQIKKKYKKKNLNEAFAVIMRKDHVRAVKEKEEPAKKDSSEKKDSGKEERVEKEPSSKKEENKKGKRKEPATADYGRILNDLEIVKM